MRKSIIFLALGTLSFSGASVAEPGDNADVFKGYVASGPALKISGTIATTGDITASIINSSDYATFVMNANHDNSSGTVTLKYVYADGTNPSYCILTINDSFSNTKYPTVTYHNCVGDLTYAGIGTFIGGGRNSGYTYAILFEKNTRK